MAEQNGPFTPRVARARISDKAKLHALWAAKEQAEADLVEFLDSEYQQLDINPAVDRIELNPWTGVVIVIRADKNPPAQPETAVTDGHLSHAGGA